MSTNILIINYFKQIYFLNNLHGEQWELQCSGILVARTTWTGPQGSKGTSSSKGGTWVGPEKNHKIEGASGSASDSSSPGE